MTSTIDIVSYIVVGMPKLKLEAQEDLMPRERRARIAAHQPSVKLSERQFAVHENAVETVETGASAEVPGQDILDSLSAVPATANKKEKQQLKHEAFIDRIKTSTAPYSKAQKRRFNRKQREELGGGLGSIEAAISTLEETTPPKDAESNAAASRGPQTKAGVGHIGKGKAATLTKAQRKHVLATERFRHPRILTSPEYAANPFQTIRTHAQNTLEKHLPPG